MFMKFSIIIANYNNAKYITETIESCLKQTYPKKEIIVVDDASTDNSVEIIKKYTNENSIKLIEHKRNKGVGAAKKTGTENASGEIIGIVDADDCLDKKAIEIMINAHKKFPKASLIYSTHYFCDNKLNIIELNKNVGEIPPAETYLTYEEKHISSFRTFKRKYYDLTSGFNPKFKKAVDKDLIYKLEETGETIFINKPLYYYRQHDKNISLAGNETKAHLWALRAKEEAYNRRKEKGENNISYKKLRAEYLWTIKILAEESIKKKEYIEYVKLLFLYGYYNRKVKETLKFIYYTLKKNIQPDKFK